MLNNANETNILTIENEDEVTTYTIKTVGSSQEDYFVVNEKEDTIYSSITGNTISINADSREESEDIEVMEVFSRAERETRNHQLHRVSTQDIYDMVGDINDMSRVATSIITLASIKYTSVAGAAVAAVVEALNAAGVQTSKALARNYKYIDIQTHEVRQSKKQMGETYYYWVEIVKRVSLR